MQRTIAAIADAKRQSDIVILSVHSHQFADGSKKNPPEFIKIFVRKCIDAGATIVVCHGPHVVRGIEVYNSGVVFYGLEILFFNMRMLITYLKNFTGNMVKQESK